MAVHSSGSWEGAWKTDLPKTLSRWPAKTCATSSMIGLAAEGTMPFFTSNNIGCSRERFLSLGGFDQTFPLAAAEDREFGLRWREQGGELIYSEAAVIDHFHPLTLRRYWRQHHNYGRGAYHLHNVLDTRGSNTPRREPLSFYIALVLGPIRRRGIRGFCGSGLAVLSQMAMIAGYSAAARR